MTPASAHTSLWFDHRHHPHRREMEILTGANVALLPDAHRLLVLLLVPMREESEIAVDAAEALNGKRIETGDARPSTITGWLNVEHPTETARLAGFTTTEEGRSDELEGELDNAGSSINDNEVG